MKIYRLLIGFCLWTISVHGQYPITIEKATWSIMDWFYASGGSWTSQSNYTFWHWVEGDTVLVDSNETSTKVYKKIWTYGEGPVIDSSKMNILGFLREDSSFKNVWFRPVNGDKDLLLYDFSGMPGDTLWIKPYLMGRLGDCEADSCRFIVERIDSIVIFDTIRKQWHFTNAYESWIEGIGSTKGLLYPGYEIIDAGMSLLCYRIGDTLEHRFSSACYIHSVGMEAPEREIPATGFSPNPMKDNSSITFEPVQFQPPYELVLFDGIGRQVRIDIVYTHSYELSKGNLPPGIYYYRVKPFQASHTLSGKLLVQ